MSLLPSEILEYHRKSRQDDPNKSIVEVLAQHKRIADEWVSRNLPSQIPDNNIYMERVSGETIKDRIEFQKVLARVESPDIKAVFVIEIQRLGRGDLEDCGHIINVFRLTNTKVITPHRVYDLTDDGDRIIFEMEMKSGNQYLEYTKRILKRGKEDAVKRGYWIPSQPPYGYDILYTGKYRTLTPNKEQAPVVKRIYEMYASGMGIHKISMVLYNEGIKPTHTEVFAKSSLTRILRNWTYIGKVTWNERVTTEGISNGIRTKRLVKNEPEIYEGMHEAIIEEDLFYRVQEMFGQHPHTKPNTELTNPLAGLLKCGKCGVALRVTGVNDKHYRYSCPRATICGNGSVITDYVLEDVANAIRTEIENREIRLESGDGSKIVEWEEQILALENRISKLDEKELKQWQDRYESDHPMPDIIFQKLNRQLNEERDRLRKTLAYLKENKPSEEISKDRIALMHNVLAKFEDDSLTPGENNLLLKEVFEKITLERDKITNNTHGTYDTTPYKLGFIFKI